MGMFSGFVYYFLGGGGRCRISPVYMPHPQLSHQVIWPKVRFKMRIGWVFASYGFSQKGGVSKCLLETLRAIWTPYYTLHFRQMGIRGSLGHPIGCFEYPISLYDLARWALGGLWDTPYAVLCTLFHSMFQPDGH